MVKNALRAFGRTPRLVSRNYFSKWKYNCKSDSTKVESSRMMGMIAVLHRIFTKRARRVLNPPIIVKDADAIMRRTIKRMLNIMYNLQTTVFDRWRGFLFNVNTQQKQKSGHKGMA